MGSRCGAPSNCCEQNAGAPCAHPIHEHRITKNEHYCEACDEQGVRKDVFHLMDLEADENGSIWEHFGMPLDHEPEDNFNPHMGTAWSIGTVVE